MMNRCANDNFGYCAGEPEWEVQPNVMEAHGTTPEMTFGGTCKHDAVHCMKYRKLSELVDPAKIPEPHYTHTITLKKPVESKAKSKATEKPKKETSQGNLF